MGIRSDLFDHLRSTLGDGYAVYVAGAEIVATPAVVINPSDPYLAPTTMAPNAAISTAMDLYLVTNRMDPSAALDHLEDMRLLVTDALKTFTPASRWTSFGSFTQTEIGGQGYASAVVEVLFRDHEDRGATIP